MKPEELEPLKQLRGCIVTVVLSGTVESMYAKCHEDMRAFRCQVSDPRCHTDICPLPSGTFPAPFSFKHFDAS